VRRSLAIAATLVVLAGTLVLPHASAALAAVAAAAEAVNITADKFVVDDAAHLATFTGKVVVKRQNLTVWAPKVVVDYGEGGPSNIRSFTASGGVRIKTGDQDATGDLATYDPRKQILTLSGNVTVTSSTGTVSGPDLVIDLKNNVSTFSGGKSGRVTGVFTPQ
jgi:lipopolysaccharide export system protein LptA